MTEPSKTLEPHEFFKRWMADHGYPPVSNGSESIRGLSMPQNWSEVRVETRTPHPAQEKPNSAPQPGTPAFVNGEIVRRLEVPVFLPCRRWHLLTFFQIIGWLLALTAVALGVWGVVT